MIKKFCIAAALAVIVSTPRPADAALLLSATINGVNVCASDNNAGCGFGTPLTDTNPTTGQIDLVNGIVIGGLEFTGSSQQATVGGTNNVLNTATTQIRNLTDQTITGTFAVSYTGFTPPVSVAYASGSVTYENAVGSTIDMRWFNDPANGQGALTPFLPQPGNQIYACTGTAAFPGDATSCVSGPIAVSDLQPFSMTLYTQFSITAGGVLVNRGQTEIKPVDDVSVPEPMTMTLLGMGMLGAVFARRRR